MHLHTRDTHQAAAPCLTNTAAWCRSWPSRLRLSAKIQQIRPLCAWSPSQGERQQQQPRPAPFFFCIFIHLWPRMFGQWMFGVCMWRVNWLAGTRGGREIDPESIIDRIAAEMALNLLPSVFFLCGCAATLWTKNVVQDCSWFKTLF